MKRLLAAVLLLWGLAAGGAAQALACSAVMSDIEFGTVTLRAGAANQTSGSLRIDCTGAGLAPSVGACVALGPGGGGAGAGLSPRHMGGAGGAALDYELRPSGNGALHGTWTSAFVLVPIGLNGRGSAVVTVFADVTSSGTATPTGRYASRFSGATDAALTYGVALCGGFGATVAIPDFSVGATVASSCEADGAALDFGRIGSSLGAGVDASAVLNMRCTSATPYAIRLSHGSGLGASGPEGRIMTGPLGRLAYGLYQDAGRAVPWGDQPATDVDATGTGANQRFTVFGRIFAGQAAPVGLYTDNVIVTIEY